MQVNEVADSELNALFCQVSTRLEEMESRLSFATERLAMEQVVKKSLQQELAEKNK